MKTFVFYTPALDIRNLDSLPRGTGARYLECVRGPHGELVAKCWRRVAPANYEILISFAYAIRR